MEITVTDYSTLREYLTYWREGIYPILIISSAPGLGKTELVKGYLPCQDCLLSGTITPVRFYEYLYTHRDYPLCLDDADSFFSNKGCYELLKSACQTTERDRKVSWLTKTTLQEGIPHSFSTSSPLAILTNTSWETGNIHKAAIADRGVCLSFVPSKATIHSYAQSLVDSEVYNWFTHYLPLMPNISLRAYILAQNMHTAQIYWQAVLPTLLGLSDGEKLVIALEEQYPTSTRKEKETLFHQKYPDIPLRRYTRCLDVLEKG